MQISILKTKDLNPKIKKKIFSLKKQSWKFNISKQKKWFIKNIGKNDQHILLEIKNKLIGYNCLRFNKIGLIKYFLLDTIIIDTNYRFKEIGSLLIFYNKILSELYNYYIFLKSHTQTKKFYIKNNFKIISKNNAELFFLYGKKINKITTNKILKHAKVEHSK